MRVEGGHVERNEGIPCVTLDGFQARPDCSFHSKTSLSDQPRQN